MSSITATITAEELAHVDRLAASRKVSRQVIVEDALRAVLKAHPADKIKAPKGAASEKE